VLSSEANDDGGGVGQGYLPRAHPNLWSPPRDVQRDAHFKRSGSRRSNVVSMASAQRWNFYKMTSK